MSRAPGLRGTGCGKLAEDWGDSRGRLAPDQPAAQPVAGGAASGGAIQEVGCLVSGRRRLRLVRMVDAGDAL
jgi:hypothetical protein